MLLASMYAAIKSRLPIWKEIFLRPLVAVANGLLIFYGVATAVRDAFSPETQAKFQLNLILHHLSWQTWVAVVATVNFFLVLEGAVTAVRKRDDKLATELADAKRAIEQLTWPPNRPQIIFTTWGQIPADHQLARQIEPSMVDGYGHSIVQYLQNGFHIINDGSPAHEVMVESFKFDQFEAKSAVVPRIGPEGGFALVWLAQAQHLQSAHSPGMWDLQGAMALAAHPETIHGPDYDVKVRVAYRDGNDVWYRSTATLTYVRSQHRLRFGPTTHEKGHFTRPV